ncbi:MAG TPA: hypothetical protein VHM90_07280 [Phycisphaerae bacterium]|nr:hypothetical protein [Phycisphaerae bacterium]
MADHQRVIEFLRDVRQGVGAAGGGGMQTVTEEVSHMAAEYAALCEQANERLRKCSGFLQQGLRSEAIHLAEEQPNLLELISQLDLPDPQQWAEFCQNNGLPVPPPLQLERAAQLNEAYAQEQPLEHLFSRHRLLALSRAPVRERLDVMRKIASIDAGNSNWEKDIRVFEKARLKELPSAFYNAVKNHDNRAIAGLNDELNQQQWYEPAPADLASAVAEAHARVQRGALEAELKKLVEPLRDAFAARSVQECQALVQRWKHLMTHAGIAAVSPELMDEIKPVVAFITEQTKRDDYLRRFNEACKAFTKLLDADAPDAQLEAGYAKLKEFKEEIPEDLTRRYMAKKTGRRKDIERTHKVKLIAIAGTVAAVVTIGLVAMFVFLRGSRSNQWADHIQKALEQHSRQGLDQARQDVEKLQASNPGMLNEPKVAAAVAAYKAQQQQYDRDAERLPAEVKKIEMATQGATTVLAKGDASMDEIRAAAAGLDAAIGEGNTMAKDFAWVDSDGKLKAALAGAQGVRNSLRDRVAAGVRKQMEEIDAALGAVVYNPTSPDLAAEAQRTLQSLDERAKALRAFPLLEGQTLAAVENLQGRIAQRRQSANASGNVAGELENIRTHATSAAELRVALNAFIQKFPSDIRTPEFKTALDALKPAETLENWQQLITGYRDPRGSYAPSSSQDAQRKLEAVTRFVSDHPELPKTAEAQAYVDYLRHAVDALADKGTWQTAMADFLASPMMTDVSYMDISDGRHIYTLGEINRVDRKMNNQVTVSFDALDPKPDDKGSYDFTKRVKVSIEPPLSVVSGPNRAPHTKVIAEIADQLKLVSESNWETFGIDLTEKVARNEAMDLVVRGMLLQVIMKTQQEVAGGSTGIGDAYDKPLGDLARQNPAQLPWWDPAKITDGTRKALKAALDEIPPAATVKQKLAAGRTAMFKALTLENMAAGVLLKDDAGAWMVYSKALPVGGATVWTIVPGQNGGTALAQIGTAGEGKYALQDAAVRNLPQGSIVFVAR